MTPGSGERGVEHLGRAGLGRDRARVADLPAALGVERGVLQEHLDVTAVGALEHADARATSTA